jgi:hypothetical protein
MSNVFSFGLEWNTLSIQDQMLKYLKPRLFEIKTSLGFNDKGESAFIIEAEKEHAVICIDLANEQRFIQIRGGLMGKYLPEGKKIPKFKKMFKDTEILEASEYFVEVVNWIGDHSGEGELHT